MLYNPIVISVLEVLIVTIPVLLTVAFVTVAERKTMASMQRRLGPNIIGYYGLLQAFADALKLLLKEYVSPTQSNLVLFFLGPIITLIFSLLGFSAIPYGPGLSILDFDLGILYMLAVSSLSTYGILLAGWSANSKYAFLGSLRSTAQLISYELILSSAILLVVLLSGSLNLITNTESQKTIWYIIPLFPVFIIFFIGSIAETNRAPFDLAEAESELVSGFMTEHAAVIFVFFFLAEYASIVLICVLTSILFLGGYLINITNFFMVIAYIYAFINVFLDSIYAFIIITLDSFSLGIYIYLPSFYDFMSNFYDLNHIVSNELLSYNSGIFCTHDMKTSIALAKDTYIEYVMVKCAGLINNPIIEGLYYGLNLGLKSCIMIFIFIWARASFPRIRYDQLMSFCWTILLPLIIALIVLYPCVLNVFSMMV